MELYQGVAVSPSGVAVVEVLITRFRSLVHPFLRLPRVQVKLFLQQGHRLQVHQFALLFLRRPAEPIVTKLMLQYSLHYRPRT